MSTKIKFSIRMNGIPAETLARERDSRAARTGAINNPA
jgi:hypothetical protein